jgi:hypothetical protein
MIRLVVMYNLPVGADENAFLVWRLMGEFENSLCGILTSSDVGEGTKS